MAVMRVREMRVDMTYGVMLVTMRMLLSGSQDNTWLIGVVVLMVLVVRMFMLVIDELVEVRMFVLLSQVQPNAKAHQ